MRQCINGVTRSSWQKLAAIEHWLGLRAARSKVSPIISLDPKSQRCAHILCRATRNSLSRQTKYPDQSQLQPVRARSMSKTWTFLQDIGPGSSTDVSLKRESQSDEDKLNQRVNEFLAKPVTLLRTLQDQSNAVKVLISEASKNKFLVLSSLATSTLFFGSWSGSSKLSKRVSHVSASALRHS